MKKTLVLAGSMLALMATIASAEGINLAWDNCGTNGSSTKSFDCASNSGTPFTMYASFIPPPGVNELLSIEAQIDITSNTASLPDWWKHGAGQCRSTNGLSVSFDFTGEPPLAPCADFFLGRASGGPSYDVGFGTPNRARLRVLGAMQAENRGPVSPTTQYYAFKVNVQRSKSTGAGLCAGCPEPMCIVLNNIKLVQPFAVGNDPDLIAPAPSNFVTWQTAVVPGCPLSTPTRNSSWGQVKSLYR